MFNTVTDSCPACKKIATLFKKCTALNIICAAICLFEGWRFVQSVKQYWFNPLVSTDDALQQAFSFYNVYHPQIFEGDLIAEMMRGYLAPLHYLLGYGITLLTKDPVVTCHWMMLLQLVLTLTFIFLSIRFVAGFAPAALGVAWFIHTRPVMQRITGGLPRGWAAAVIVAVFYFMLTKRHKAVLVALLCGCLLHPPATLIAAAMYGIYLVLSLISKNERKAAFRRLLIYVALSPLYIAVTYFVVSRPEHIGQMVDFKTASAMPEFGSPHGRFTFLPLASIKWDLLQFGFQPFFHYLYKPKFVWGDYSIILLGWKRWLLWLIPFSFLTLLFFDWRKKRRLNLQIVALFSAIILVYLASRLLAFKLYVPNRHLQFPLTVALIIAFCTLLWSVLNRSEDGKSSTFKDAWLSFLGMFLLGGVVLLGTGGGMYGDANFNYSLYKKGKIFAWIRKNTAPTALIAGHPTHIDAMQLFGMRKAFVTTETTHPFYPEYYKEMKRRYIISLRAHYARDWQEFVDLLDPEGIDYFVFSRKRFYPEVLMKERSLIFAPLNELAAELTSYDLQEYLYKKLPREVDLEEAPFMLFKDEQSALIDIKVLKEWLAAGKALDDVK